MYQRLHRVLYAALPLEWALNLELLLSYPVRLLGTVLIASTVDRCRSTRRCLGRIATRSPGTPSSTTSELNAVAVDGQFPYALLAIDRLRRARTATGRAWRGLRWPSSPDPSGSSVFKCKTSRIGPSGPWPSGGCARSSSRSLATPDSSPGSIGPTDSSLTSVHRYAW